MCEGGRNRLARRFGALGTRVAVLVLARLALASGAAVPAHDLLLAADSAWHPIEEGVISLRAVVRERDGTAAASGLDVYVKGSDKVLCVFREGRQQGRRILVVGSRVWLIVPGSKRPVAVSANQRLLGAASVADVARLRLADEFQGSPRSGPELVGSTPCWVLDLTAKSPRASYASGTLWIGQEDRLPRRLRLALRSGKEAKEILFKVFRRDGGRAVLAEMEIRHLLAHERGEVTVLEFLGNRHVPLDAAIFAPDGARSFSGVP
ncbi:MAG: outer membrane lipoprotein-sorting protein [Acidobacteriia bacterium]|nr:outer membrane lipoprotein-sorting protein [Terriglobia bacterium]